MFHSRMFFFITNYGKHTIKIKKIIDNFKALVVLHMIISLVLHYLKSEDQGYPVTVIKFCSQTCFQTKNGDVFLSIHYVNIKKTTCLFVSNILLRILVR